MLGLRSSFLEEEASLQWDTTPILTTAMVTKDPTLEATSTPATNTDSNKGSNYRKHSDIYSGKSFFLPFDGEEEGVESWVHSVQLPPR